MPETVPFGTVFFGHKSDEVDTYFLDTDMMLHEIVHHCALHRLSLRRRESIKWMPMRFIIAITHFDEDMDSLFSCDNIDLSSLDSIVGLDDLISFLLEISYSSKFPLISCGTTGRHSRKK